MLHIRFHFKIIYFTLAFIWMSCTDIIPFEVIENDNINVKPVDIIIDGAVFSTHGKQYVKISKPSSWNIDATYQPISNAEVYVIDTLKTSYLYQNSDQEGLYESIDSFAGKPGMLYTLVVKYNGKEYKASDRMKHNSLSSFIPVTRDPVYDPYSLNYNIPIPQHNFGYPQPFIMVSEVKEKNTDSVNDMMGYKRGNYQNFWQSRSHEDIHYHAGNQVDGLFHESKYILGIFAKPDDTIVFYTFSVSAHYYNFQLQLFSETDWAESLFSPADGNIITNISEGGLGYFFASDIKEFEISAKVIINR